MSKIVFIGWGNVAQNFVNPFQSVGFEIVQVLTHESSSPFPTIHSIEHIDLHADLYFIAVNDDQLAQVVSSLPSLNGLVLHCSGSKGMEVFPADLRAGVLYPLQTFRKELKNLLVDVPFFIEANSDFDLAEMKKWVDFWGGKAFQLNPQQKQKIHLAAVWAMNFSNAMYVVSEKILKEFEIPFDILKPLLTQAQMNAFSLGPKQAQTGPAIRHDQNLIQKQSQEMTEELEKTIYLAISKLIQENS